MKSIILGLIFAFSFSSAFSQNNITFRSNLPYPGEKLANIWGYVDKTNKEYALVGTSFGMSIVDVSDPDNPVEVKQVLGPNSTWREIRTKGNFAFVTTEGGDKGLQIVDLSSLPNASNVVSKYWSPSISGTVLKTIHALQVDGNFLYLYGSNIGQGGAVIADVTDPWNPVYAGKYDNDYIHDGYVRNDTLYAGQIYAGRVAIVDMNIKTSPVLLATQNTPGAFTHNTWLSDNSKYMFTTDEVDNSVLASYDLSDLSNIIELDRVQMNPGSNSVVHNTYYKNGYNVTSWYKDGVVITDTYKPDNMVITGSYDTYSQGSGSGMSGCWGVYPYLPSGNILASDIDNGLYVLTPTYTRACYLEGNVKDSVTKAMMSNVLVEILTTTASEKTNLSGIYKTGHAKKGLYSIRFSKAGYHTKTIQNVSLDNGLVTNLNVELSPLTGYAVSGFVGNTLNSAGVANAYVSIENSTYSYSGTTDGSGNFTIANVFPGTYTVTAGKWGYITSCNSGKAISQNSAPLNFTLSKGIYDDFTFDFGWTEMGNATTGRWIRAKPDGTNYGSGTGNANPGVDVNSDCSSKCYVTGNNGGTYYDDDVDNGYTILTSPSFDLSGYTNPYLTYNRWFFNVMSNNPPNDTLFIKLSNGISTVVVETVTSNTSGSSAWKPSKIKIKDFINLTANMKLIVETEDLNIYGGNTLECGFDKFMIKDSSSVGIEILNGENARFNIYPNPFNGTSVLNYKGAKANESIYIYDISGRMVYNELLKNAEGELLLPSTLSGGVYFVRKSNSLKSIKLIKTE